MNLNYKIEDISYTVTEYCPGPCRYCSIWKLPNKKNEELTVHAAGDKVVGVGDLVSIGFSSKNCHLFNGQGQVFEKLAA